MSQGTAPVLSHINVWLFDLDLTLYDPEHAIMAQVRDRIAAFVEDYFKVSSEEAHQIRYNYWRKYGTTLGGLMAEHGVEPHAYLDFVHDVDMTKLTPCARLRAGIEALPGRKLIFTNADAKYAERVLTARGLDGVFEGMFDIHQMAHRPKPEPDSYAKICATFAIEPKSTIFIEDSAHNLEPAKAMGMTTVWINHSSGTEAGSERTTYVDHEITHVADWLHSLHTNIKEQEPA